MNYEKELRKRANKIAKLQNKVVDEQIKLDDVKELVVKDISATKTTTATKIIEVQKQTEVTVKALEESRDARVADLKLLLVTY